MQSAWAILLGTEYYTFWVCICSLRYPACNAHVPFYHLWHAQLYNIFPHYLINGKTFEKKKLLNTKCVILYSLQIWSETFLILKEISEIKCVSVFM
jgi:hypothetical protein